MATRVRDGVKRKPRPRTIYALAQDPPDLPEGSMPIGQADRQEYEVIVRVLMHYRESIAKLEQQIVEHAELTYGVNLGPQGDYALNLAEGRLDRR